MPTITRFEEIEAWQTARDLTKLIYLFTDKGKFARDFGLKDQIHRASISMMSNIAEGFESQTQAQFIRYLGIAKHLLANCALNYMFPTTSNIFLRNSLQWVLQWLKKHLANLRALLPILKPTPNLKNFVKKPQSTKSNLST